MIATIFEYKLNEDNIEQYTEYARLLREHVNTIDGFISIETFQSKTDPQKSLTLAFFKDEKAVHTWRNHPEHRKGQSLGRELFYCDYRLRLADIKRDYTKNRRDQAPKYSQVLHHN
jgi:heme-degrading monooxygenase HmoA